MNIIVFIVVFIAGLYVGVLLSCLLINDKLNRIDDDVLDRIEQIEKREGEEKDDDQERNS